jgi:hypothetical protein
MPNQHMPVMLADITEATEHMSTVITEAHLLAPQVIKAIRRLIVALILPEAIRHTVVD